GIYRGLLARVVLVGCRRGFLGAVGRGLGLPARWLPDRAEFRGPDCGLRARATGAVSAEPRVMAGSSCEVFEQNKRTPRTRERSLTLAAFLPWGSSRDARHAESA